MSESTLSQDQIDVEVQDLALNSMIRESQSIDIESLKGLPTPDAMYLLGVLIHMDFSLYNTISTRSFTSVLDIICAIIAYSWAFPTRSKRISVSILLWLI